MVDESVVTVVRSYMRALRDHKLMVRFGVVFGSQARGWSDEWRDIDLLVVSPRFDGQRSRQDVDLLWRLAARTDSRIEFVGGSRGLKELEREVDSGSYQVAFSLYPTSIEEVLAVADAGEVMLPKSTWFEPKLRSGLFIHKL